MTAQQEVVLTTADGRRAISARGFRQLRTQFGGWTKGVPTAAFNALWYHANRHPSCGLHQLEVKGPMGTEPALMVDELIEFVAGLAPQHGILNLGAMGTGFLQEVVRVLKE